MALPLTKDYRHYYSLSQTPPTPIRQTTTSPMKLLTPSTNNNKSLLQHSLIYPPQLQCIALLARSYRIPILRPTQISDLRTMSTVDKLLYNCSTKI